jgi:hypothetical protein
MMVMALGETVHFCTPDDALVVRNILGLYIQILSQFVKPPLKDGLSKPKKYFKVNTIREMYTL